MTPEETPAWEEELRNAFTHALAQTMDYLRATYAGAVVERNQLRERVKYLEQRLAEERGRKG